MSKIYCSNCGKLIDLNSNFCRYCGAAQHGEESAVFRAQDAPLKTLTAPSDRDLAESANTHYALKDRVVERRHLASGAIWIFFFNYVAKMFILIPVLAPLITKRFLGGKEPGMLLGILVESACATILVLPYILFIFGELSLVTLPANLLVVPLIPLAMVFSALAGLVGMLLPAVAGWFAWPATVLMTFMLDAAHVLSQVPKAYIEHVKFPLAYMIAAYLALASLCLVLWHRTRQNGTITEKNQE